MRIESVDDDLPVWVSCRADDDVIVVTGEYSPGDGWGIRACAPKMKSCGSTPSGVELCRFRVPMSLLDEDMLSVMESIAKKDGEVTTFISPCGAMGMYSVKRKQHGLG